MQQHSAWRLKPSGAALQLVIIRWRPRSQPDTQLDTQTDIRCNQPEEQSSCWIQLVFNVGFVAHWFIAVNVCTKLNISSLRVQLGWPIVELLQYHNIDTTRNDSMYFSYIWSQKCICAYFWYTSVLRSYDKCLHWHQVAKYFVQLNGSDCQLCLMLPFSMFVYIGC